MHLHHYAILSFSIFLLCLTLPTDISAQPGQGQQAAPVRSHVVQKHTVSEEIEAIGTSKADEWVTLSAKVTENIRAIHFKDGQFVEKGDVLVEFTNTEESANLAEAQSTLNEAESQYNRFKKLNEDGFSSSQELDVRRRALNNAKAQLDAVLARLEDRVIRAPFDGYLGLRDISVGTLVSPGTEVIDVYKLNPIKLDFTLPETYLFAVDENSTIYASSAADPSTRLEGDVTAIDPKIDPVSRSFQVRALIDNSDNALKPGMLMRVMVKKPQRKMIMVPEKAIISVKDDHFVYVINDDQTVAKRQISVGIRRLGAVEVKSGLQTDDIIVSEGIMRLGIPGMKVNIVGADEIAKAALQ